MPHFLALIFTLALLQTLLSNTHAASTRSKITPTCSIDSNGVHKCPKNAPQEPSGLHPRAETFFSQKIPTSETSPRYYFKANFFVSHATRTTVFQLLNGDKSVSDVYKPVLFIVVWKKSNGNLKVCMFESCKYVWDDIPSGFTIEMEASGKTATIKVSGRSQVFDLVRPLNGAYRPRGAQQVRWGAYHHDISGTTSASEAQVRVYRISSRGF